MNTPIKIITHHAVSLKKHKALDVGQWHLDRWGGYRPSKIRKDVARYAGYHFIIEWDGTIEQCRKIEEEGIHCKGQNFSSIGVCFMGNNDEYMPSQAQKDAWVVLFTDIQKQYPEITANDIYPHRKYAPKSCHGALLSDEYWTVQLGAQKRATLKALKEKLLQLLNQLVVLLAQERMQK